MSVNSVISQPHLTLAQQLLNSYGVGQDNDGDEGTETSAQKAAEAAKAAVSKVSDLPADPNRGRNVNTSS